MAVASVPPTTSLPSPPGEDGGGIAAMSPPLPGPPPQPRAPRRRPIAPTAAIPQREGRQVWVDGEAIALFRCSDGFRAVSAVCPHAGGPLADGIVAGRTVTCPLHSRVVDLESGEVDDCEGGVRVYAVVEDDGFVYLEDRDGAE